MRIYNIDAEMSVIGCLILECKDTKKILSSLSAKCFYTDEAKKTFDIIKKLYKANQSIDEVKVIQAGADKSFVISCAKFAPVVDRGLEYAKDVADCYHARFLDQSIEEFKAYGDTTNFDTPAEAQKRLEEITKQSKAIVNHITKSNDEKIQDICISYANNFDNKIDKIDTGFWQLDGLLGGLQRGNMFVVAARPGMGKTAFAINCMMRMCSQGTRVLFDSLEMTKEQIMDRIISCGMKINSRKISSRNLSETERETMNSLLNEIYTTYSLNIDDTPGVDIDYIERQLDKVPVDVLIIDYIGLIKPDSRYKNKYEAVGEISKDLKKLAKKYNIAVIVLCQLNRETEKNKGGIPNLSNLRDTGQIEQDADYIMFLQVDKEDTPQREYYDGKFIVAKNRHGRCGRIDVTARLNYFKFQEKEI